MTTSPELFEEFFRAVNQGRDPFPWQSRLFREVIKHGTWPQTLDLPTGSGKTSVLDIALFHLACDQHRQAPLRIAFVVDRRLIVDQTADHADHILSLLKSPPAGTILADVASSLQRFSDEPLHVARLRGGMPLETFWARTPTQPTILLSTVDQVGSRLLFRGYGVSSSMQPIHAGLLGEDCLIFLDEAHLSEPFRQTAKAIRARLVTLSATPTSSTTSSGTSPHQNLSADLSPSAASLPHLAPGVSRGMRSEPFGLNEHDHQHKVLRKRLNAAKPTKLPPDADYVQQALDLSTLGTKGGTANTVLIVVNRVAEARSIFEKVAKVDGAQAALFIGRIRDLDRQRNTAEFTPRLRSFNPTPGDPLFVVATQCIEAGADFDFDALVTQIAPLDALRQRFGRLNRLGEKTGTQAIIIASKNDLSAKKPDPIYGDRSANCWALLSQIPDLDFGINALKNQLATLDSSGARSEPKDAPVLMPPYLDFWTQTNPRPAVEPDVPLFLHGPQSGPPDVNLVWRADLGFLNKDDEERLTDLLTLMPPRSAESMSVPIYAAQAWLQGKPLVPVADLEGSALSHDERIPGVPLGQVFRWAGPDDPRTKLIWPEEIKPGDTLIIPSHYGGSDRWGWNPDSKESVPDLAREAALPYRSRRFVVRLHSAFLGDAWPRAEKLINDYHDEPKELVDHLLTLEGLPETLRSDLILLQNTKRMPLLEEPYQSRGVILVLQPGLKQQAEMESSLPESDDDASLLNRDQPLAGHTSDVVRVTNKFTAALVLESDRARDLQIAAELHDLGKGDRRFQTYLHGKPSPEGEVLAKSDRPRSSPRAEQRLRDNSGLPDYWRHEALSVRLAIEHPRLKDAADPALVLWLIGTHHGHGRPFFPHADELDDKTRTILAPTGELQKLPAAPGPQRLDFDWHGLDWPALFAELQHRYGPWSLAHYESILRLADHRASEEAAAQ